MTTYELTQVGRGCEYPEPSDKFWLPRVKFRAKRPNGDRYGVIVTKEDDTPELVAQFRAQLESIGIDPSRLERVDVPPMPSGLTEDQNEALWGLIGWYTARSAPGPGWQPA